MGTVTTCLNKEIEMVIGFSQQRKNSLQLYEKSYRNTPHLTILKIIVLFKSKSRDLYNKLEAYSFGGVQKIAYKYILAFAISSCERTCVHV